MPVICSPQDFNEEQLYVDLRTIFGQQLLLKCEGFNFAGSIKLKAAKEMVEAAERDGRLGPGSVLVESSSGNMGVALSMLAASMSARTQRSPASSLTSSRAATRRTKSALSSPE